MVTGRSSLKIGVQGWFLILPLLFGTRKTSFFFISSEGWETIPGENLDDTPNFFVAWVLLCLVCLYIHVYLYIFPRVWGFESSFVFFLQIKSILVYRNNITVAWRESKDIWRLFQILMSSSPPSLSLFTFSVQSRWAKFERMSRLSRRVSTLALWVKKRNDDLGYSSFFFFFL